MESESQSLKPLLQKLEFYIPAIYLISALYILIPYYNHFYRLGVIFLYCLTAPLSLISLVFILIPFALIKHRLKRVLLMLGLVLLILFVQPRIEGWRYSITDFYLQNTYCKSNVPIREEILGGIREIYGEDLPSPTGAFENSSHCIIVVCDEEFFYCDWSKVRIGP